jgi:hypothetical protein
MNLLLTLVCISSLVLLLILMGVNTFLWLRLSSWRKSLDTSLSQLAVKSVNQDNAMDAIVTVLETQAEQLGLIRLSHEQLQKPLKLILTRQSKLQKKLEALSGPQELSPFPLGTSEEEADLKEMWKSDLITIEQAGSMLADLGFDPDVTTTW